MTFSPPVVAAETFRFGQFELEPASGELRRAGRRRRLQAQPFKLLTLLVRRAGVIVTYDDIRAALWGEDTFVEFDQAVHYAVRQIRDALGDSAERPVYIETVPRQGYRFIAPVETSAAAFGPRSTAEPPVAAPPLPGPTTVRLQKALWTNIAELRVAQERHRRNQIVLVGLLIAVAAAFAAYVLLR